MSKKGSSRTIRHKTESVLLSSAQSWSRRQVQVHTDVHFILIFGSSVWSFLSRLLKHLFAT